MIARRKVVAALLAAWSVAAATSPVRAQWVLPSTNPSARAAGMGSASSAVIWSGPLNPWANPALHGYASDLMLRWNRAQLGNDSLDSHAGIGGVEYGWGGVALAYDRDEYVGRRVYSTGVYSTGLDSIPVYLVEEATWRLDRWGGGLSVSHVLEAVSRWKGQRTPPGFTRHFDLGFGISSKRAQILEAHAVAGTASATDLGLLARVTPWPEPRGKRPSVDITYAYSVLREPMQRLTFPAYDMPEHRRHAAATRVGIPLGASDTAGGGGRAVRWMAQEDHPVLALTLAADIDRLNHGNGEYFGGELEFANTLAFRYGHIGGSGGGSSFGLGIAPPIGHVARVRYDYAHEGSGRHTVSAWVDLIALLGKDAAPDAVTPP